MSEGPVATGGGCAPLEMRRCQYTWTENGSCLRISLVKDDRTPQRTD